MSRAGGKISRKPGQRLRWIFAVMALHWGTTAVLLGWWNHLLTDQSERIFELERSHPAWSEAAQSNYRKTARMVHAETVWFAAVIFLTSGFFVWLYVRDERRTRSLQAFFASLTHELRTPLTSIRLQAESLADSCPDDEYQQTLAARLIQDVGKLEGQVDRTLELARVEGGGQSFVQSIDLSTMVARALSTWKKDYPDRLDIDNRIDATHVLADPNALQTILRNLFENTLRHGKRDRIQVVLAARQKDEQVELTYSDNGVGFDGDPNRLAKIFAKGAESSGAGVGLYLVRALMESMGGRASFRSDDGFVVDLTFKGGERVA